MHMLRPLIPALFLALSSLPAWAGGIAVVDFQEAINKVEEGNQTRQEIDALFEQKQQAIAAMEQQIMLKQQEYEANFALLNDATRQQRQQEIMQMGSTYEQARGQAEMEMQQIYTEKMEMLINKMRTISEQIAAEKGYDIVLESTEGGVVYAGPTVTNITEDLIKRYDAQ